MSRCFLEVTFGTLKAGNSISAPHIHNLLAVINYKQYI
jgi:hypothetical protein